MPAAPGSLIGIDCRGIRTKSCRDWRGNLRPGLRLSPEAIGSPLPRLGGSRTGRRLNATIRRNGFLFELGPQCPRFPLPVWRLLRELDLESEFVAGDPGAKRYILWGGQLHRLAITLLGKLSDRDGFGACIHVND